MKKIILLIAFMLFLKLGFSKNHYYDYSYLFFWRTSLNFTVAYNYPSYFEPRSWVYLPSISASIGFLPTELIAKTVLLSFANISLQIGVTTPMDKPRLFHTLSLAPISFHTIYEGSYRNKHFISIEPCINFNFINTGFDYKYNKKFSTSIGISIYFNLFTNRFLEL